MSNFCKKFEKNNELIEMSVVNGYIDRTSAWLFGSQRQLTPKKTGS